MYATLYSQFKEEKSNQLKKATKQLSTDDLIRCTKFLAALPQNSFIEALETARSNNQAITAKDGESILAQDLKGLILIVNKFNVGFYLNIKSQGQAPLFSTAVPYVLYAHKLHHGTSYESWRDYEHLDKIMNPYLVQLLNYEGNLPSYSSEELLKLRQKAIVRAGAVQAPTSWTLVRTGEDEFDALPQCIRRMLLQSWVHNVEYRSKYMINDPQNWDNMPPTLEEGYDSEGNLIDELAGW